MSLADQVSTIVLVMMENRSFDHMLGHLSYESIVPAVDGLRRPLKQYENLFGGAVVTPFRMKDGTLPADLPHEFEAVGAQLDWMEDAGRFTMRGFVKSFAESLGGDPGPRPAPMGFLPSDQVPITSFLARSYCTCDTWFSALPTSTQPNRTIAFCGASGIFDTGLRLIDVDDIVFDWLGRAGVRWRVYHDGLSFFALYPRAWGHVLGPNFRDFEDLFRDFSSEGDATFPQVVIVEPSYADAPHLGSDHPNDNHAPLAVGWGEEFLRRTYEAVTSDPARWARTVMILYYDEHGGFWDHVPPPRVVYDVGPGRHQFVSLGPRVPAAVISPLVEAGSTSSAAGVVLDHTSVLQLLAERFTPGRPYSDDVERRRQAGVGSVSTLLTRDTPRADTPPAPAEPIRVVSALGESVVTPPTSGMQAAFEHAALRLLDERPAETAAKYPELVHWRAVAAAARR